MLNHSSNIHGRGQLILLQELELMEVDSARITSPPPAIDNRVAVSVTSFPTTMHDESPNTRLDRADEILYK